MSITAGPSRSFSSVPQRYAPPSRPTLSASKAACRGRGSYQVELELDDPELSSVHASIQFDAGAFHLTDLGSTNGTRLNDRPVTAQELAHGDRIQIGGQCQRFCQTV